MTPWRRRHFYVTYAGYCMRHLYRRIRHLLYWLPAIWNDYWWDGNYVLQLLRHKLAHAAAAFRTQGMSMDAPRDAASMEGAIVLLDRLIADSYIEGDLHVWSQKWGTVVFEPMEDHPGFTRFVGFENEKTPEDRELCHKESCEMDGKHNTLRKADLEEVFATLRDHIDEWWD